MVTFLMNDVDKYLHFDAQVLNLDAITIKGLPNLKFKHSFSLYFGTRNQFLHFKFDYLEA